MIPLVPCPMVLGLCGVEVGVRVVDFDGPTGTQP